MIPVKCIGPDPYWAGLLYNTRERFEHGETRLLPEALALKFLTHKDTFERGEAPTKPQSADEVAAAAVTEAEKQQAQKEQQQTEVYELFDQIDRMDKASLAEFSQKYGQVLDKRKTVNALRADAKSFVDRFGAL